MSKKITVDQLSQLACKYGLTLADLQTIREVEAAGKGFLPDGRPKILFERHKFSEFTGRVFNVSHPDISSPIRGGYKGGTGEWARFDKAQKLDREAAIKATSWGAGQVMGFHYKDLGFITPQEFLNANFKDEASQFDIMLRFITSPKNRGMYLALKEKDWATFAKLYNGPKYAENEYDTKLANAFKKHSTATV
jgi:hypothetical protein